MTPIILAAPDLASEPGLVAAAGAAGLTVLRRCVDASDLLACAAAEPGVAVVISAGVPRLSGDLVARMDPASRTVIALAGDDHDRARVRAWGVGVVIALGEPQAVIASIAAALAAASPGGRVPSDGGVGPAGRAESVDAVDSSPGVFDTGVWSQGPGRLVTVWGPPGAPGRTCTAIALAEALASQGRQVLLVDADVHAASIGLMLGIAEESSGLIVACRHAENGTLGPRTLRASARGLGRGLAVLTGVPRPERWPDARPGALSDLWQACRAAFEITVVDIGADLQDEGQGSVNPVLSPQRNAAARTALVQSDAVVGVCRADPLGLSRLALAYQGLRSAAPDARRVVGVVTGARRPGSWRQIRAAVSGIGIDDPVVRLEPVPGQVRRRLARGLLPSESTSQRRERASLAELARRIGEVQVPTRV